MSSLVENKKVGILMLAVTGTIAILVWVFYYSLGKLIAETCTHGTKCIMYRTLNIQLELGVAVVLVFASIGLYIMFSKPEEKVIIKRTRTRNKKINLSTLDRDEKKAIRLLQKEEKAMFQKDLMEKLGIGKVKMTRLLDKLEAKQFLIRKRHGMNNFVVLRD